MIRLGINQRDTPRQPNKVLLTLRVRRPNRMPNPVTVGARTGHHHTISKDRGKTLLAEVEQLTKRGQHVVRNRVPSALAVEVAG